MDVPKECALILSAKQTENKEVSNIGNTLTKETTNHDGNDQDHNNTGGIHINGNNNHIEEVDPK